MDALSRILAVAAGAAAGAVARYLINVSPLQNLLQPFPFPTFLINLTGSFLIGFLMILSTERLHAGENLRLAVTVGFLGAFTTFSTFELEIWTLVEENKYLTALLYLLLSVALGFAGVALGIRLAKKI